MKAAQPSSFWKGARRWLPGVVISIVALFLVFRLASWQDLSTAFESLRLLNVVIAVALTLISLGTRALAWRITLRGKASLRQAFFIINEGYLLNNLFPLRAGEFGRAVFMGQASGMGPFHVLSTIVIERIFDLAMAATLLLITLPLALGMAWARPVAIVTLILVVVGLVLMYLAARYNQWVQDFVSRLGARWPLVQKQVIPRIGSLLNGLSVITDPLRFLAAFSMIAISWVIWVVIYYVMLIPIVPQAQFWWAAFADGVLALGIAIPSAPAALGVFEAALVGALSLLDVNVSAATAYAISMHFLQFVVTGLLGLWGLVLEGHSLSAVFSQAKSRE
ncbi:MAG: flippase-like domain-containing protein [Chloroflexi bacterium]|nr:lysylphosphatidylglycerol synthase transmembrane domain-containing protein [Anaerolineaceae bacterium]NMB89881.1 flippase-like domain-containing protein [Chloroflexota bacterium]